MHTGVNNHEQSIDALNTGRIQAGRPSLGSWLTYALGARVKICRPFWSSPIRPDFRWAASGTGRTAGSPRFIKGRSCGRLSREFSIWIPCLTFAAGLQPEFLSYLGRINAEHLDRHPRETDLDARIKSYELAARMQVDAKEALDVSRESKAVHRLYGLDDPVTREYGTRCLIARRMVERGVRFVQIFTGDQAWDHHNGIVASLPRMCRRTDKPAAALVRDLKSTVCSTRLSFTGAAKWADSQ